MRDRTACSEKMRHEMLVETHIEILNGQSSVLFSNEPFEKRPVMTIGDFVFVPITRRKQAVLVLFLKIVELLFPAYPYDQAIMFCTF